MQSVSIQIAGELAPELRSAVERLLGRPVASNEEISVVAVPPQQVPPSTDRAALVQGLRDLLRRRAEKVLGVPSEQIDATIDDAVDQARHSRG